MRKSIILAMLLCIAIISLAMPVQAATTEVNVIKYAPDGTTILNETTVSYTWMEANLPVQGDGVTEYYHQGPIFNWPPGPWDEAETTNYKSRGVVKGTDVKDLCDLVGGMYQGDEVKISANDGFNKWFGYENVYLPRSRRGPMVLTWWRSDDGYVPDYYSGMKLVFFADDSVNPEGKHIFGSWDMHECFDEKYWHNFSSIYPATSGLSVKSVDKIEIHSSNCLGDCYDGTTCEGTLIAENVPCWECLIEADRSWGPTTNCPDREMYCLEGTCITGTCPACANGVDDDDDDLIDCDDPECACCCDATEDNNDPTPCVPELATFTLLGSGLMMVAGLIQYRRRG